jgi:hypothetical protein
MASKGTRYSEEQIIRGLLEAIFHDDYRSA